MSGLTLAAALLALTGPVSIAATAPTAPAETNPLNGRWVADLDTQASTGHTDLYLVSEGVYRCDSCEPPRAYPADGVVRPVAGASQVRESVKIAGPRTIVTRIETPGEVRTTTMTVSSDDQSATYVSLDDWPGIAGPLRTEFLARRIAPTPKGAHPVSGGWRGVRYVEVPEAYRAVELQVTGDVVVRSTLTRGHYTATLGGPPVALEGVAGSSTVVSVRQPDARSLVETFTDHGAFVLEQLYRVSADGRSLVSITKNPDGQVFTVTSHR